MARGTGTVTVKFLGDVKDLKKAADDADGMLGKVGSSIGGMAKTAAMVGVPALVGFGAAAVKAFSESEQVAAQTAAVIKSTGGVARVTADDVDRLSGSLSKMSGVDDELIAEGQNLLLTFTNVRNAVGEGNDVFDQATKSALDMSVALGTDMKSASMLVGKALNDPIKGLTALTRSGVSFTKEQKEQVKALVESGKTMDAQKLILKELEVQFGGSAKAAGDTFAGQLNKLKVQAGNFMEEAGGKLVPILLKVGELFGEVLPPAIAGLQRIWGAFHESLQGAGTNTSDNPLIRFAGQAGDAISRLMPVIENIGAVVSDVFGAVTGWVNAHRDQISAALGQVQATFESAFGAVRAVVVAAVDFLSGVWRVFGDDLTRFAREAWAGIAEVFRGAMNTIGGILDLIKAVFTGKWGDAWTALKKIVDGAWDTIFGVVRNAVTNVIPTILAGAGQVIGSTARTAFDGIKSAFTGVINWVIDRWNGLEFTFPEVGFGPFKTPGFTLGMPDIPRLASGGPFRGAAIVGEAGPELLVGGRSGRVVPNDQLGGVNVVVNGALDPVAVAAQIEQVLTRYRRQGGVLRFT